MEEPFRVKSIFEELAALQEADDDNPDAAAGGDDAGGDTGNDDINIDADLKQEDIADDTNDTGGDDNNDAGDDIGDLGGDDDLGDLGGDDDGGDTGGDTGGLDSGTGDEDEEPNQANTDIFSSLTKEEQQLKIQKLKELFGELYSSCEDLSKKIDNIDYDIVNHETVSRLASALYRTRDYLSDYITKVFANKSYIENNIEFVKFMSTISSITKVTEELLKEKEKVQKEDKK